MKKTVVAIFEDERVDRFVYEKLFKSFADRIELHVFDNPEKGIAKAIDTNFDVVFIDIHFWDNFGGIPILNKLKKITNNQFIAVAMTSLLQEGDLEYIIKAGFSVCLEKPIAFETIFPLQRDLSGLQDS
jgi:CheY-like chemotaxis protein